MPTKPPLTTENWRAELKKQLLKQESFVFGIPSAQHQQRILDFVEQLLKDVSLALLERVEKEVIDIEVKTSRATKQQLAKLTTLKAEMEKEV